MKIVREDVRQLLIEYSNKYQVPTWITAAIVEVESRFDPTRIGDNGTSYGLLQLHKGGGQGDGYTEEQLLDPRTNLEIGMPPIAWAYQKGVQKGLEGFALLDFVAGSSGHPWYEGYTPSYYKKQLKAAYDNGNELAGGVSSYPSGDPKKWLTGDTKGLDPTFARRLAALGESLGEKIVVSSGYRSIAEQEKLYNKSDRSGKWVAPPGRSRHNYGLAVDVSNPKVQAMKNSELAKFGLYKPMNYEPWHIEPVETKGKSLEEIKNLAEEGLAFSTGIMQEIRKLTRNGTILIEGEEDTGIFAILRQLDETAQFKPINWDTIRHPFQFIQEEAKAFMTRTLIVLLGVLIAGLSLYKIVSSRR